MNILKQTKKVVNNIKTGYVINFGNIEEMIEYAKYVSRENVKKLEDAIIVNGNYNRMLQFAKEVPGADIEKIRDVLKSVDALDKLIQDRKTKKDERTK